MAKRNFSIRVVFCVDCIDARFKGNHKIILNSWLDMDSNTTINFDSLFRVRTLNEIVTMDKDKCRFDYFNRILTYAID